MLITILILINIGVIVYFGIVFIRLHEDVRMMSVEIENLKNEFTNVVERVELEKIHTQKRIKKGDEFLGI
mgnify:CR=1 FL=1|tara:strand:- start:288 stop:497 length:210 start_codon:yes stop_codon:yes gene_type:complete